MLSFYRETHYTSQYGLFYRFFLSRLECRFGKDIVSKYNPKKYCFEDNSNYNEEISSLCNNEKDFGGISQGFAFKRAIELKEDYEKEKI